MKQTDLKFQDPKFDFEVNADYGEKKVSAEEAWVARSKNLLNEVSARAPSRRKLCLLVDRKNYCTAKY